MSDNEYLAMYDVRGIQNYIFNTNTLKEIIGGSLIVRDLIFDAFKNAIMSEFNEGEYIIDYDESHPQPLMFFKDLGLKMEVLYNGGGNLVVLYRTNEAIINQINKKISMELIRKSYSLSLACAYVPVSQRSEYKEDYQRLNEKMNEVKDNQPEIKMTGGFPITLTDPVSGYPLSEYSGNQRVSRESFLKLKKYKEVKKTENDIKLVSDYIDEFVTEKGNESLIAIVHIDGNSFGHSITQIIGNAHTYEDAANRMRVLSHNIDQAFDVEAINDIDSSLSEMAEQANMKNRKRPFFRWIIKAGDDITFVCNARVAMRCVQTFMSSIHKHSIDENINWGNSIGPFSACAGVAIMHSGFPFSRGYELAEELCDSAKKRAKSIDKGKNGEIEDYVDFQYCYSGLTNSLSKLRLQNYYSDDGIDLCLRPYRIRLDDQKTPYDIDQLYTNLRRLKSIPRSKAKWLRDAYYEGRSSLTHAVNEITSRDSASHLSDHIDDYYTDIKDGKCATYYDALEMLDLHWEDAENEDNHQTEE